MANATLNAVLGQYAGSSNIASAFPQLPSQASPLNLDLIQIVDNNGQGVLVNVDYLGAVHNPAVSPTNGTRIGVFQTSLSSGDTTAHYFANTFSNPSLLDIIQIVNSGYNVHYW